MMVVSVLMSMIMMMSVIAGGHEIGAALWIEWGFDLSDLDCEIEQQLPHRRITTQPKTIAENLHWHVAVAQKPSDARERRRIGRADFKQKLGLCDNFDQAAILEDQRVVGT
jgi:hypothetical protein